MTIGFPKPRPKLLEKRDAKREQERQQREVYAIVAQRDQYRCRCCGRSGKYDATVAADALHRHHLIYRSKSGADTTSNLLTLCAICHSLIHARQLWPLETDADAQVRFEMHEAAVVDVFGTRQVPGHVRIVASSRRRA
jgi:hypothetical protein